MFTFKLPLATFSATLTSSMTGLVIIRDTINAITAAMINVNSENPIMKYFDATARK